MAADTFKDQKWQQRFSTMGDIAEGKFEEQADLEGVKWERYGLNRPAPSMGRWPAFIRYTPDYITSTKLIEVKGVGADGLVKIKYENLEALDLWSEHLPVEVFVWNSSRKESAWFPLDATFLTWAYANCKTSRFPDNNKEYLEIPYDELVNQTWTPF